MTWKYCKSTMCSLLPKLDIITTELSTYDIITISETHLDQTISNHNIFIDCFHPPIHKDRNRHGGGVAIYITDQTAFYKVNICLTQTKLSKENFLYAQLVILMLTCYQVKALNLNQCYKNKIKKIWLTVPPTLQPQKVHVLIY